MINNNVTGDLGDQTLEVRMADIRGSQADTAAAANYYFTLTVIEGEDFGSVFKLDKPEIVLGRGEGVDIRLNDSKASRRHLVIATQPLGSHDKAVRIVAIDLDSKNGTYVNGERVSEVELHSSDKLRVGDTILKFEVKDRLDLSYHERLYKQATRDSLTGLWNRSHAQEAMEKFLSIAERYNRPFSLLLFDIDFFKSVNDTYGHDIGDVVLQTTAQVVTSQLRSHDIAARYGGEEFIVLMPETATEGAMTAAERLRGAIEKVDFAPLGCPQRVTVSVGIAQFPTCGRTIEKLFKQADEALYRAKQSGRNCACLAAAFQPE